MARRKKYMSIRNELHELRRQGDGAGDDLTTQVHYLASQYLADSSLNADVSQFDFSGSVLIRTCSSISL